MQQTEKYKLNLIEPNDPFLPDGLNQSTQKIENALGGEAAARAAGDAALSARITTLEGHKLAWGSFVGDNASTRVIPLPFTPSVVLVQHPSYRIPCLGILGTDTFSYAKPVENGIEVRNINSSTGDLNVRTMTYFYIALC